MNQQPETAEAYNNHGLAKRTSGDLDGALGDFDKAIELKPNLGKPIPIVLWLRKQKAMRLVHRPILTKHLN